MNNTSSVWYSRNEEAKKILVDKINSFKDVGRCKVTIDFEVCLTYDNYVFYKLLDELNMSDYCVTRSDEGNGFYYWYLGGIKCQGIMNPECKSSYDEQWLGVEVLDNVENNLSSVKERFFNDPTYAAKILLVGKLND